MINSLSFQEETLQIDRRLENYLIDKNDLEKDITGLRELSTQFAKEKHGIQLRIDSIATDATHYQQLLSEIESEQTYAQAQIVNHSISCLGLNIFLLLSG